MKAQAYDIFSGSLDNPLWLGVVETLEAACERMKKRAQETPEHYFVFCVSTQTVLAALDTSERAGA